MEYARLATRLYNQPLLITQDKAEVIEAIFRAHVEGRSDTVPKYEAPPPEQWLLAGPVPLRPSDAGYGVADGGIAVIRVYGTLVHRGSSLDAMSGLCGYNRLAAQLAAAQSDPNVRGILLDIDSPGGEASGVFDLCEYIRASEKKVYAIANEMAASGGYAIASAAHRLTMPSSAVVGSIGVIMMHVDQSQADQKRGYVYTPIFSGARKADFNSHAPLTSEGRASAQARCDHLYQVFVDAIASARDVDPEVVRSTEASLLAPQAALAAGFIDGIATYAETIQMLADDVSSGLRFFGLSAASSAKSQLKETTMTEQDKAVADARVQAHAEGKTEGLKEGQATGHAEGVKAGASAERARIKAILQCAEAKDRPVLASHLALETDMSAEQASAMLGKAAAETTASDNPLAAAMGKIPNPNAGADNIDLSTSAAPQIDPAGIYAARAAARQN